MPLEYVAPDHKRLTLARGKHRRGLRIGARIEASDERFLKEPFSGNDVRLYESPNHARNFIECIRSRKDPICTAEIGHRSATV